jgi:hypothetical protein
VAASAVKRKNMQLEKSIKINAFVKNTSSGIVKLYNANAQKPGN